LFEEIEEEEDDDDDDIENVVESLQFNFDTIRVATSNFFEANKLGHGGFGVVYQVSNTFDLDAPHILHYQSIYYTRAGYICRVNSLMGRR
jgi:hypothetical protein